MTLLKNENGALPLDKEQSVLILYPAERRGPSVDYAVSRLQKEQLLDASKVTSMCYADLTADNAALQQAMASADKLMHAQNDPRGRQADTGDKRRAIIVQDCTFRNYKRLPALR